MPGFDPVSLFTAGYLLASSPACPAPADEPVVNVLFTQKEPEFITNLTSAQLERNTAESDRAALKGSDAAAHYTADRRAETLQVVRQEGQSFTGGYMTGGLSAKYDLEYATRPAFGEPPKNCVYVGKVSLEILYTPKIYVSANYREYACANAVITAHEKNHVARDLLAISVFLPQAKKTLQAILQHVNGQGPFMPGTALAEGSAAINGKIDSEMTKEVFDPLALLRAQYQAVLDTPASYLRQSMLCPAWQWKAGGGAK